MKNIIITCCLSWCSWLTLDTSCVTQLTNCLMCLRLSPTTHANDVHCFLLCNVLQVWEHLTCSLDGPTLKGVISWPLVIRSLSTGDGDNLQPNKHKHLYNLRLLYKCFVFYQEYTRQRHTNIVFNVWPLSYQTPRSGDPILFAQYQAIVYDIDWMLVR